MTDADTQIAGASPVANFVAAAGLLPEPSVVDAAALHHVRGPLLTADLVDGGGDTIGVVAVLDDPSGDPDGVLQSLAQAAAAESGGGTSIQPGGPVADGAELASQFSTPVTVAAFGDGQRVRALLVTPVDRRGGAGAGAGVGAGGAAAPTGLPGVAGPLDKLYNVALDVSVELGRTRVTLAEVLDYDVGSVVELDRAAGAPVDIRVNGTLLAQGEVVLIDDEYAVRVTAIIDPSGGG
jgi:flagellar motor switch protein FliN/FliY